MKRLINFSIYIKKEKKTKKVREIIKIYDYARGLLSSRDSRRHRSYASRNFREARGFSYIWVCHIRNLNIMRSGARERKKASVDCLAGKARERAHESLTKIHKIRRGTKDKIKTTISSGESAPLLPSRVYPFFSRRGGIDGAFKCQADEV